MFLKPFTNICNAMQTGFSIPVNQNLQISTDFLMLRKKRIYGFIQKSTLQNYICIIS